MLVKREVLLAKIESVYNTDPTPTGADNAILVENLSQSNEGLRMNERNAVRSSLAPLKQVFGGMLRSISFDVEIKGPGAAYSASVRPEIDVLLRACGMGVTVDATPSSETATYAPVSSAHESCTFYYYQDGILTKMTGARGNASFSLEGGTHGKISFTFTGHTSTPTDVTLATPTYDSTVPVPFIGASFSIDSFAAVISALNFDLSNTLSTPPDVNAADGYGEIQITSRDVNGSFDPEHELVATEAFEANLRSGASMALATGTIGATQYNQYAISMPAVSYREIGQADRDGVRTLDVGFGAYESTTDDEVSIVFS